MSKVIYHSAEFISTSEQDATMVSHVVQEGSEVWCTFKIKGVNFLSKINNPSEYHDTTVNIDKLVSQLTKFKEALIQWKNQQPKSSLKAKSS